MELNLFQIAEEKKNEKLQSYNMNWKCKIFQRPNFNVANNCNECMRVGVFTFVVCLTDENNA